MSKIRELLNAKIQEIGTRHNATMTVDWLKQAYQNLLGRDPSQDEAVRDANDILQGTRTADQVIADIERTPEAQRRALPAALGPSPNAAATYFPSPGAYTISAPAPASRWPLLLSAAALAWLAWEIL